MIPIIWAKPDGWDHYDIFLKMNMHLLSNVHSSWLMKCASVK